MRKCGVCSRGLRDGDIPEAVRVGPEGANPVCVAALKLTSGAEAVAPGLYHACPDCVTALKPFIAVRITEALREEARIDAVVRKGQPYPVDDVKPDDLTANQLV